MRKILSSRLFRCLICLILVCCFLINASPIRAKATGLEAAAATGVAVVAVEIVVAGIFQALGVMAGSDPTSFSTQVNECVTWLINNTSYVVNGMVQVMGFMSAEGFMRSFVMKDMIQAVWEWLFDHKVVTSAVRSYDADFTYTFFNGESVSSSATYNVLRFTYVKNVTTYYYEVSFSSSNGGFTDSSGSSCGSSVQVNGDTYWYAYAFTTTIKNYTSNWNGSLYLGTFSSLTTSSAVALAIGYYLDGTYDSKYRADDLKLGQIQGPYNGQEIIDIETAEIYTDYIQDAEYYEYHGDGGTDNESGGSDGSEDGIPVPLPYLPVGIPSTEFDDIASQDQDQAQSGETGLEFDPITDSDSGADSNPDTNPDTDPDSGSSSWQPPSDMGKFTLDLKDYFPFCIPFDLYDFFLCLNADPVAPVIEWVIPLPGGDTYPLEIDLSAFDSVAQLLRRLQLLLFCVGLAFKTRDLIKG